MEKIKINESQLRNLISKSIMEAMKFSRTTDKENPKRNVGPKDENVNFFVTIGSGSSRQIVGDKGFKTREAAERKAKSLRDRGKEGVSIIRKVVEESSRMTLREDDKYGDIDFSRTNGVRLPSGGDDSGFHFTPRETKGALRNLQNALIKVMDMLNGAAMGEEITKELWDQCYSFYNFISQYYIEMDDECRDIKGTWTQNHADVPFIRKYTDDFTIPPFYNKNGEQIDERERFGSNFQPHKR